MADLNELLWHSPGGTGKLPIIDSTPARNRTGHILNTSQAPASSPPHFNYSL